MTSQGLASTGISWKPRSAAKQALVARMWRRTPARLRNSPRLERWPVAVQLTQTKRVTPQWIGGPPASGPDMDAITATSSRVTVRTTRMPVIAFRAKQWTNGQARELCSLYRLCERGQPVYKKCENCTGHVYACNNDACKGSASETGSKGKTARRGNGFGS